MLLPLGEHALDHRLQSGVEARQHLPVADPLVVRDQRLFVLAVQREGRRLGGDKLALVTCARFDRVQIHCRQRRDRRRHRERVPGKARDDLAMQVSAMDRQHLLLPLQHLAQSDNPRLAPQIFKLEAKGHRFDRKREGREGYARYWWKGWEEPSRPSSAPPHPLPPNQPGKYSANL